MDIPKKSNTKKYPSANLIYWGTWSIPDICSCAKGQWWSILCCLPFLDFFVYFRNLHQVKFLSSNKIDKNNKKLLELRINSVKEQNKQWKPDGEKTEKNLESHIVKGAVSVRSQFVTVR